MGQNLSFVAAFVARLVERCNGAGLSLFFSCLCTGGFRFPGKCLPGSVSRVQSPFMRAWADYFGFPFAPGGEGALFTSQGCMCTIYGLGNC